MVPRVRTDESAHRVVAVDLGGTLTKIALADAAGALSEVERLPTRLDAGRLDPDRLVATVAERVTRAGGSCVGYGVVVPGVIDSATRTVRAAPNLGWVDVPLGPLLSAALELPGAVGHDVRAGGLAEWRLGAGVGTANLLFVALGTGIAGAVIIDGRLVEADGYAGEIGHLRVSAAAEHRCACGLFGCLETVASAAGVARSYARLTGLPVGADRVADRARAGDQAAQQAFAVAAAGLAEALAAYVAIAGPELVVVGGGLAGSAGLFLPGLERALADRLSFHRVPRLVVGSLGPDAGLIGAGLTGWDAVAGTRR